jgi:localization factor PodJL
MKSFRVAAWTILIAAQLAAQQPDSTAALVQLAREGNPAACYALGLAHESGAGRAKNLTEAARLYAIAANAGIAAAQARLAYLYQTGAGVQRDLAKALELYRQAAATDPDAQFQLALALVNGTGTPADPAGGRLLLAQAATVDHQEAQLMLGLMMAQGQGGPRNEFGARRWMQRAATGPNREVATRAADVQKRIESNLLSHRSWGVETLIAVVLGLAVLGAIIGEGDSYDPTNYNQASHQRRLACEQSCASVAHASTRTMIGMMNASMHCRARC